MMGRNTLDQGCLDLYTSCPLFKPVSHVRTQKMNLRWGHWTSFLLFPRWPHCINPLSTFHYCLPIYSSSWEQVAKPGFKGCQVQDSAANNTGDSLIQHCVGVGIGSGCGRAARKALRAGVTNVSELVLSSSSSSPLKPSFYFFNEATMLPGRKWLV